MIEQFAPQRDVAETRLVIRPNRAMRPAQLIAAFAFVAVASIVVAAFSWSQGNVFAPLFAVLELSLLALCLRLVWLAGDKAEVVAIGPAEVAVRRLPELSEAFRAPPQWVRLDHRDGRLMLASSGRAVEIGACLGEAERRSLAERLRGLIGAASSSRTPGPSGRHDINAGVTQ